MFRISNTQDYIYPFQNLSLGFILKIFLKFRKFQPRNSYKIYCYRKKKCNQARTYRCPVLALLRASSYEPGNRASPEWEISARSTEVKHNQNGGT